MEQEPRFADWLERTADPTAIIEGVTVKALRLLHWNAPFAALMGIRDPASANQDLKTAVARSQPLDPTRRTQARADFENSNRRALKHGHYLARWQFCQPDGTPLLAEVELTAMPSLGKRAFCARIRDIGQLEATRQELNDMLMRYQALFEGANDAIGLARIEHGEPVFFSANRALAELYGAASTDDLLGKNPAQFAPPLQADGTPSTERAAAAVREMIERGVARFEWQAVRLDGQSTALEVVLSPQPLWGEQVLQFAARDIGPLKIALARFQELFEAASDAVGFIIPTNGARCFVQCNMALCQMYGAKDKSEVIGRTPIDFSPLTQPDGQLSADIARDVYEQALRQGQSRFEWFGKRVDGGEFWIDVSLTAQPSWGEGAVHFSGRDITDRKQAEQTLARAEELARITLQSIGDGVITTDAQARVTSLNPVAEQLTGWSQAQAQGRPVTQVFEIVNEDTRAPVDNPLLRCLADGRVVGLANHTVLISRNGSEYAIEDSAAPIRLPDGTVAGAIIVFHDVTGTRRLAAEMSRQARHDPLTGLPNRREFERRLDELLEQARRTDAMHALCYIDLDQFKLVNDGCGHSAGDQLLIELASLLQQHIRRGDMLARLGGDEFGLLLTDCPPDKAAEIANELLATVGDFRFHWGERGFTVGASMGLVPISTSAVSAAELLTEADLACYAAKDLGRNRIHLFRPGDADLARRRSEMQWATELRIAMEEQRLLLYVQPIHALGSAGSEPWFEVLLRLRHKDGRIVLPGTFLPAAERFGLMPLIDNYVLTRAIDCLLDPQRVGDVRLSVNLSGRSLDDSTVLATFEHYFADPRRVPGRLCIELTEAMAVAHLGRTREFINRLRAQGCQFALDDFGTGMSSFAYLKHLPMDYLKLDGSFVRDISREPIDHAMVEAIHRLSGIMGIETIAEFVEDTATLELLRGIGVNYGQGFVLGRPAPIEGLFEQIPRSAGLTA